MTPARLIIDAPTAEIDSTSGQLWMLGTTGIEEQPGPSLTRLLAGFNDLATAESARDRLGLGRVEEVTDDDWLDSWREYATITRAGERFVIRPIWLEHQINPGEVVLHLDPGRAFGSGSHPTTRLSLGLMEDLLEGNERVLDIGCGSGLLAIGAARVGATDVDAIDIDPEAIRVCELNAVRNGVGELVNVSASHLANLTGPYDVVLANIAAATLAELAPEVLPLLAARGRVIVSGMLTDQVASVIAAYSPHVELERAEADGWVAVVLGTL